MCDETTDGYYFCSNDVVLFDLEPGTEPVSLVAIANGRALDVLYGLSTLRPVRQVLFLDFNPAQIAHLRRVIDLIGQSRDRHAFLADLLCLTVPAPVWNRLGDIPADGTSGVGAFLPLGEFGQRERAFWAGVEFDAAAFHARHGLTAEKTADGLRVDAAVMGGFNRYLVTLLPLPDDHDRERIPVFGLGYGQGFLASDHSFATLQALLACTPISFQCGDAAVILEPALQQWRYEPLVLWASNLFAPGFTQTYKSLAALWRRLLDLGCGPLDLRILQDRQRYRMLPPQVRSNRKAGWKRLSSHVIAFRAVARWLDGAEGLHITATDETPSTLPGLRTLPVQRFLAEGVAPGPYPALFLHILHGYGCPLEQWREVLRLAAASCRRLVILEHHRASPDFIGTPTPTLMPDDVRAVLGPEVGWETLVGPKGEIRNFVMAYGGTAPRWSAGMQPGAILTPMTDDLPEMEELNDPEFRLYQLDHVMHRIERIALATLRDWLETMPDAPAAAGDFYRSQVRDGRLFNGIHAAVARYLVETAAPDDRVVEIGCGLGPLCWLLAANGLQVTGFEGNKGRHDGAAHLLDRVLPADAARRVQLIDGIFPFAFNGEMLRGAGRRILVCTDTVNGLTAQNATLIVRMFFLFDQIVINLRTFGIVRDAGEQQALLAALTSAGFILQRELLSGSAGLCVVLSPPLAGMTAP